MNIDPKGVIRLLNLWLSMDSEALTALFETTTDVATELAAENRIATEVRQEAIASTEDEAGQPEILSMDVLSMINGLFGGKRIAVVRNEFGRITRFEAYTP